jgi:metal-responsive CopG/Arc/MetJ family transcriptional regulator
MPEGDQMVSISMRLPQRLVDWYDRAGAGVVTRSCVMRQALEEFASTDEDT